MGTSSAVIAGGGIGGLSAAVALRRVGWRVTVLERAPELREVGAGVTLFANAVRALDSLDLGVAVRARGGTGGPGGVRAPSGRWLSRVDAEAMTRWLGTEAIGIHRAALHRILCDALPTTCLVTGAEVVDVDPGRADDPSAPATLTFQRNGQRESVAADLVVGADGINSVLRARLWPDLPPPVYQGSTAWRAVTRRAGPLPVTITWERGAEFGVVPIGDDQVYWYAAVNAEPGERSPDELAAVRARFGSWHDPIPALLAGTRPEAVLRDDIRYLATPLPSYVTGRVALLGDSAHAMTPNLGQGACQALEDAVVLAACCAGEPRLGAALNGYDQRRRPRTQEVARAAARTGQFGQRLENPVALALRNAVMRLTPPRVTLNSMARYADWRPPALPVAAEDGGNG